MRTQNPRGFLRVGRNFGCYRMCLGRQRPGTSGLSARIDPSEFFNARRSRFLNRPSQATDDPRMIFIRRFTALLRLPACGELINLNQGRLERFQSKTKPATPVPNFNFSAPVPVVISEDCERNIVQFRSIHRVI